MRSALVEMVPSETVPDLKSSKGHADGQRTGEQAACNYNVLIMENLSDASADLREIMVARGQAHCKDDGVEKKRQS